MLALFVPYCRRCGTTISSLAPIKYDGHYYHFSCAMRTILEISLKPRPKKGNES